MCQWALGDPTFQLPCWKTISNKIQQLYDTEASKFRCNPDSPANMEEQLQSKQDWVPLSSHFPDDLQKLLMKTSEEEQWAYRVGSHILFY